MFFVRDCAREEPEITEFIGTHILSMQQQQQKGTGSLKRFNALSEIVLSEKQQ